MRMTTTKRAFVFCVCLLLLLVTGGEVFLAVYASAAEAPAYNVEKSWIEEDFAKIGLDTSHYGKNPNGKRNVLYFAEIAYTAEASDKDDDYALYLWVHNPTCEAINLNGKNTVNLQIGDRVRRGAPLIHVSHTEDFFYYKFKVSDTETAKLLEAARSYASRYQGERRYRISGIQLQVGTALPTEDEVAKSFIFTGYAKGYDESSEAASTLALKTEGLDVIHLDLEHTTWRSDAKKPVRDAIHTAYFGLPQEYLENYGNLQRIAAEWDEYRTKEIFVTTSGNAMYELSPWVGKDVGMGIGEKLTFRVLWDREESIVIDSVLGHDTVSYFYHAGYNDSKTDKVGIRGAAYASDYKTVPAIHWLFKADAVDSKVSSRELERWMREYTAKHPDALAAGRYSASLFTDTLDSDRQKYDPDGDHHIEHEFDVDIDLHNIQVAGGFWDRLFGDGLKDVTGISPIVAITDAAALAELRAWNSENTEDVAEFEAKYYIENDAGSSGNVLRDLQSILNKGLCPVLFRFAVTDYSASQAWFDNTDAWYGLDGSKNLTEMNGYVAQETVFLNFDVISLSFKTKEGGNELAVIPVVADPIDIIPGLIAPPESEEREMPEWLSALLLIVGVVVLIALIVIFFPIVKVVFSGFAVILEIGLIILLFPLRLISRLLRGRR